MDKELSAIKMHEMGVNIADIFTIDELEKFVEGFKIIIRERKSCCSRGIVVTNSNDKLLKTKVSQAVLYNVILKEQNIRLMSFVIIGGT